MFNDARQLPQNQTLQADICIIGGGPAGITIAREMIGTRNKVILLESGGLELEPETQDLYRGKNIGRHYYDLDICRLRFFGGTSNHWGGWIRRLQPMDFVKRPWVPYSGWPITHGDLIPYWERAEILMGFGPTGFDAMALSKGYDGIKPFPFDPKHMHAEATHWRQPMHFGEKFGPELKKADNVTVMFHANVVQIDRSGSRTAIDTVRYATLDGRKGWVRARTFILATGGVENARMLMISNIGNDHDLVGRFFMDHPQPAAGMLVTIDDTDERWTPYAYPHPDRHSENVPAGCMVPSPEVQERERMINNAVNFVFVRPYFSKGFSSLRRAMGRAESHDQSTATFGENLRNVISDIDGIARDAWHRLESGRTVLQMMEVGVLAQQAPNPDSRVTLDSESDRFGLPRLKMHWQLTDFDRHGVIRTVHHVARELGRMGLARIKLEFKDWAPSFDYGYHHMGTTRMSNDPKTGVVDSNCRVHGMANLYVAGSSVFPTSGNSPPTYNLVALALRMADHLKTNA